MWSAHSVRCFVSATTSPIGGNFLQNEGRLAAHGVFSLSRPHHTAPAVTPHPALGELLPPARRRREGSQRTESSRSAHHHTQRNTSSSRTLLPQAHSPTTKSGIQRKSKRKGSLCPRSGSRSQLPAESCTRSSPSLPPGGQRPSINGCSLRHWRMHTLRCRLWPSVSYNSSPGRWPVSAAVVSANLETLQEKENKMVKQI